MASPAPDLLSAVTPNEREFVIVWNVLAKLASRPDLGRVPAAARTAADLMLEIMRAADCLAHHAARRCALTGPCLTDI